MLRPVERFPVAIDAADDDGGRVHIGRIDGTRGGSLWPVLTLALAVGAVLGLSLPIYF